MSEIPKVEMARVLNSGSRARKDDVEAPEIDSIVLEKEENPSETEQGKQARKSEQAIEEALTRLPPG